MLSVALISHQALNVDLAEIHLTGFRLHACPAHAYTIASWPTAMNTAGTVR